MSHDLRKLLIECKELIDADAIDAKNIGHRDEYDYFTSLSGRISAALQRAQERERRMVELLLDLRPSAPHILSARIDELLKEVGE